MIAVIDLLTPTPPASRTVNLVIWALVVGTLVAWQALTAVSATWPSLGALMRLARRRTATRWFVLAAWAWLGWHTFVRGTWG